MRNVLLYTDENGNWIAEVLSLPGCNSDGRTREEALARVRDAIALYLENLQRESLSIPEDYANCELVNVELVA
jgi:predicted RNase H-like HicB family nuclease